MRSTIASTALANSAPSPSRRSSYQRRVSRTSSSASGRKTTRRVTLFLTTSGERRTKEPRCRVSSRGRPTGDAARPVGQGSTPVPALARRRTDSPTTHSQVGPIAGREPQQLREYAGFHGVIFACSIRCGKRVRWVHEPTKVTCDGCQAYRNFTVIFPCSRKHKCANIKGGERCPKPKPENL